MRRSKGFTLVELIIVIAIFSMLVIVLFRTYNTIMRLSVRSEFQKNIQTDVLFVNQVMHNLADTYTIDYDAYASDEISSNGMVETLHLMEASNTGHKVTLSYDDGCYAGDLDRDALKDAFGHDYDCSLWYQERDEKEIITEKTKLTNPQTLVTHVGRQLIPYQSNDETLTQAANANGPYRSINPYDTIAYPGFVMYWRAYHQGYGLRGVTDVSQVIQWFFTLTDKAQL